MYIIQHNNFILNFFFSIGNAAESAANCSCWTTTKSNYSHNDPNSTGFATESGILLPISQQLHISQLCLSPAYHYVIT